MVLNGKYGEFAVTESLICAVVQIGVSDFDRCLIERFRIHREAMVLRCNLDLVRQEVLDGGVCPPVAEFHLERLPPQCDRKEVVAAADAEDGRFLDEPFEVLYGITVRSRVSRSVMPWRTSTGS